MSQCTAREPDPCKRALLAAGWIEAPQVGGWVHPTLEFAWPFADAYDLQVEADRCRMHPRKARPCPSPLLHESLREWARKRRVG